MGDFQEHRDRGLETSAIVTGYASLEDISSSINTANMQSQEDLKTVQRQLLDIIDFLPDATFVIDKDKKVIAWNQAIVDMTGVCQEDIIGKGDYAYAVHFYGSPRPLLIDIIFSDDRGPKPEFENIKRRGNTLFSENFAPSLYKGKGAYLWETASPFFDSEGNLIGAIESIRDITELKIMEKKLKHLATHDALTNIPNRYSLEKALQRAVTRAKRGKISALVLIDLDNFKLINDTLGHGAGDELLIALARVLKNNLREEDFIARLGGDEFAVLLEVDSAKKAESIAEDLRRNVDEAELGLAIYRSRFNLTISIGIIMIDGALDSQRLLSEVDAALYAAKERGRNRVVFIKPDDNVAAKLSEINELLFLLKSAINENKFTLMFQPVAQLSDGKIRHHEVLIRLRDKGGQLISPGVFIPVAERFGLMPEIDFWVLQSALDVLRKDRKIKLFLNLSGVSMGDEALLESMERNIRKCGIDLTRIGFEITETAAVKDLLRAERWIRRLKGMGCQFALDDFGIGFSSFSYLRALPVDYLKIDGSFVRNLDKESTHRALVQAMNTVAHALGKKTIAEFVENKDVLNILQELDVDCGQGYYLGKPAFVPGGIVQDICVKPDQPIWDTEQLN